MKKYIIGNWKENGTYQEALVYRRLFGEYMGLNSEPNIFVGIAPTAPILPLMTSDLYSLVAQDVSKYPKGAYTGEYSASILASIGVSYVIIGHSERRSLFNEDAEVLSQKIKECEEAGMGIVYCVGETLEQYQNCTGIDAVINDIELLEGFKNNLIVAYEPIYAIGSGIGAEKEYVGQVIGKIKQKLKTLLGKDIPVLYGGSVNASNINDYVCEGISDGVLVGGASITPTSFITLIDKVRLC